MHDLDGWVPITCDERERIIHDHTHGKLTVFSSLTDPEGEYGIPLVYTEWGIADHPVLRDHLYYTADREPSQCIHFLKEAQDKNVGEAVRAVAAELFEPFEPFVRRVLEAMVPAEEADRDHT